MDRTCNKCNQLKPIELFSYSGHTYKDGTKARRGECKDCQFSRQKKKASIYNAKWYENNKQAVIDRVNKWRETNMDKAYNYSARSRAKHRYNTVGYHTEIEWQQVLEVFKHSCIYCGSNDNITKDHIIPLSKGGTDDIDNIAPACKSCNSSKGNRLIDEWLGGDAV